MDAAHRHVHIAAHDSFNYHAFLNYWLEAVLYDGKDVLHVAIPDEVLRRQLVIYLVSKVKLYVCFSILRENVEIIETV